MVQAVVAIQAPVEPGPRLVSRMHQKVHPFVVKQGEQGDQRTRGRRCPGGSIADIAERGCDPQRDQHRRANDRPTGPDRIQPAQQQPVKVIGFAVVAFVGVPRSQLLTDPPSLRRVQQSPMNDPFDRPDSKGHTDRDRKVKPGRIAQPCSGRSHTEQGDRNDTR